MLDEQQLAQLLREHWTRKPLLTRVADEEIRSLDRELGSLAPTEVIGRYAGAVASVWFEDASGHAQAVDMPPADALKFYAAGMTVFLPEVRTPTIDRWQAQLARALGRPPGGALASMFLSNTGNVSGWHFDHIENFTLQLRGTKTWRIVENRHAPLPTVNCSLRTERPYLEDLWLYCRKPLPDNVDDHAEPVTVGPGSLIYVPRGYWHQVEAAADSVSLLIGFPALTWADVVLPALGTLLLRREEWRENAIYPYDRPASIRAEARLKTLCETLRHVIDEIEPADLLPHVRDVSPDAESCGMFRRSPLCTLGMYDAGQGEAQLVATVHQGSLSRRFEARVPASWVPVLEDLDRRSTISRQALETRYPELNAAIPVLLDVLVSLQFIRPLVVERNGAGQTAAVTEPGR